MTKSTKEAFDSFRCFAKDNAPGHALFRADFQCQNCDALSNNLELFKQEPCSRNPVQPLQVQSVKPECLPAKLSTPKAPTPSPLANPDELSRAELARSAPTLCSALDIETPRPEAKAAESDKVILLAELQEAQAQLEQLVILQSLEAERKRLQELQLKKQHEQRKQQPENSSDKIGEPSL